MFSGPVQSQLGEDLARLIPSSVYVMSWLRQEKPNNAADHLLLHNGNYSAEAEEALKDLSRLVTGNGFGNFSSVGLRTILSQHPLEAWGQVVRLIVTASNPPLVPQHVSKELVDNATNFWEYAQEGDSFDDLYQVLTPILDEMPLRSYDAFASLCGLVRDCSSSLAKVSSDVGIAVLLQGKHAYTSNDASAISSLFLNMASEAERLFGQSAHKKYGFGLGVRRIARKLDLEMSTVNTPERRRAQELREFYSVVDPPLQDVAESILEYHKFVDVAQALYVKYYMVPEKWLRPLQEQKKKGVRMDWFNNERVLSPRHYGNQLPQANRLAFLINPMQSPMDVLVDEFIDSELAYYRTLLGIGKYYVEEIRSMAKGRQGAAAQVGLGLTLQEIDFLFGARYREIISFSHQFLVMLEPLHLIRTPINYGTRWEALAKCVQEVAPLALFKAYQSYSESYPDCHSLVKTKLKRKVKKKVVTFVDVWNTVRERVPEMEIAPFVDTMDLPLKRVQVYVTILTGIGKNLDKNSKAYESVYAAIDRIQNAAKQLNNSSVPITV
mmetsp:Transcript_18381/g.23991  ORF Transcript_18381/g.23991 Transcript_18381/m.23991 type:complete len:552 (-) Transcript_18381:334-1989(-)